VSPDGLRPAVIPNEASVRKFSGKHATGHHAKRDIEQGGQLETTIHGLIGMEPYHQSNVEEKRQGFLRVSYGAATAWIVVLHDSAVSRPGRYGGVTSRLAVGRWAKQGMRPGSDGEGTAKEARPLFKILRFYVARQRFDQVLVDEHSQVARRVKTFREATDDRRERLVRGQIRDRSSDSLLWMKAQVLDRSDPMPVGSAAGICNDRIDSVKISEQPGKVAFPTRDIQYDSLSKEIDTVRCS
jgi:hypothetical protein